MKKLEQLFILSFIICTQAFAVKITLHEKNATVWLREQVIKGNIDSIINPDGTLFINRTAINFQFNAADSSFSVPVNLSEGLNTILIGVDSSGKEIYSDTLKFTLGYKLGPEIYAYATVSGRDVFLHAQTINNPDSAKLFYAWTADTSNPSAVSLSGAADTLLSFTLPSNSQLGEYYFNLLITSSNNDTSYARTLVTVDSSGIIPFDISTDHAAWIDKAVLYEITPSIFANGGSSWDKIANKIPDLVRLGINTIWLQPVFSTYGGGHGYDVTDYFGVRSDVGTADRLAALIKTAKLHGLKVILDIPINHTAIQHPYAQNSITYGKDSHYYNFYQRTFDSAAYSQYYQYVNGFVDYIWWNNLPNLNYSNPEVQNWMIEVCKYWIEKYDIDGYRFDSIWGVNSRNPEFTQQFRLALKRVKPDILMLAEDKATWPSVFDKRFDAAYDWTPEQSWVSHWSWQTSYSASSDPTIFNNNNQNNRSSLLRNALTNNGNGFASNAIVMHFMENNDTQRFVAFHSVAQTKMTAGLLFSLNGVPMMYNGQEIGDTEYPYSAEYIFYPGLPIDYNDPDKLFPFYQRLIQLRKLVPAFTSENYEEVTVSPNSYIFAFRRWLGNQNVITVMNMGNTTANVTISVPVNKMNLDSTKTYYMTDMLNGGVYSGKPADFSSVNIQVNQYTTRMFLFADTVMAVTGLSEVAVNTPSKFQLDQNYPNPFNPATTIRFSLPYSGHVNLKVYDILGREVAALLNSEKQAGNYSVQFNGLNLASGVYIYRIEFAGQSYVKKMMLLK